MFRDICDYLVALARHSSAFLMGGIPAAVLYVAGILVNAPIPRNIALGFIAFGLLAATFGAWREQRHAVMQLERHQNALASRLNVRAQLTNFLGEGESLKESAIARELPWKQAAGWVFKVLDYLQKSPAVDLNPSFAVRFRYPQPQPESHALVGESRRYWNDLNHRTVALIAFIQELG